MPLFRVRHIEPPDGIGLVLAFTDGVSRADTEVHKRVPVVIVAAWTGQWHSMGSHCWTSVFPMSWVWMK